MAVAGATRVLLVLSVLAWPSAQAAWQVHSGGGFIECGFGAYAISTNDRCAETTAEPADETFEFVPSGPGMVRAAVFELRWEPASVASAHRLALSFPGPDAKDYAINATGQLVQGFMVRGPSLLQVRLEGSPDGLPLYATGEPLTFNVRPTGSSLDGTTADPTGLGGASGLILQQPVEIAVSWFYDEAAPANYSFFDPSTWPRAEQSEAPVSEEPAAPPPEATPAVEQDFALPAFAPKPTNAVTVRASGADVAWYMLAWPAAISLAACALLRVPWVRAALLLFFTRIQRDSVLDHPRRGLLEALVRAVPGIGRNEARGRLGWGAGAFDHHLRALLKSGHVRAVDELGRTRLFPPGVAAAPPIATGQRLLDFFKAHPGLRASDAARRLGLPDKTVLYHTNWLARKGLLERRLVERTGRYYARGA